MNVVDIVGTSPLAMDAISGRMASVQLMDMHEYKMDMLNS